MKRTILIACVGSAAAGSIEFVSSDIASSRRALDNIKAEWSQGLKFLGRAATVSGKYDRSERKDFLKEVSLSGKSGAIDYEMTTNFDDHNGVSLSTKTQDGTTVQAEGNWNGLSARVTKVSASRATTLRGQDCDLELSHELESSESKVTLSTLLGSGVKAIGRLTSANGASKLTYDFEYDTTLSEGRSLSAKVNPQAGTGEVEYEDSKSLDGTLTANFPLGGSPKVTFKRGFTF